MSGYVAVGDPKAPTYIRSDSVKRLASVTSVVFDCDGVLIDILASYGKAVAAVTAELVFAMTGTPIDPDKIDDGVNYAYKSVGGFNNDWDLAYAFTVLLLDSLPEPDKAELENRSAASLGETGLRGRLRFYENNPGKRMIVRDVKGVLLRAVGMLDATGVASVDAFLDGRLTETRRAIGYPGQVGESLIPTLFEERFSGPSLFRETWKMEPQLEPKGPAYVENETLIVTEETLDTLAGMFGVGGLGIASGSAENTAKQVLGSVTRYFRRGAEVWMEDVIRDTAEAGRNLAKPEPHSLLKVAKALPRGGIILYVGDTAADHMMEKRANAALNRFAFSGVYESTYSVEDAKKAFFESGADIVMPTVNELPNALRYARGEK